MADITDPEKVGRLGVHDAEPTDRRDHTSPRVAPEHGETASQRSRHSHSSHTSSVASDDTDPLEPLELAMSGNGAEAFQEVTQVRTTTSIGSSASRPPDYEVVFEDADSDNPKLWSVWYRAWIIFSISFTTWVVVLYSTSYTAAIPGLMEEFHVSSRPVATLGVTTYLLGLAAGSLLVAPASELYGRRPVYISCMICFAILVIPSCVAQSLETIIVVRFFGAAFGSVMVSNSAGTVVDISSEETRALVMSLWSIAPLNGPVTGPVIGGFVYQYLGWRWDNWLVLILAGAGCVSMMFTKETYAPIILQKKTAQIKKETDDERWWCRYDQKLSKKELIKISLFRPFVLAFTEPILWFFNLWISLIYGILYLCFVAYPIVFTQHRGWGPGLSGLAFVGIGIGTMIAIVCEPLWRRIINTHPKDPKTGRVPPEATARVMIIGAILTPLGQLGFSWTCLPIWIHWAVPIAFGIPFGMGNALSFIYGSNYLAGACEYSRYLLPLLGIFLGLAPVWSRTSAPGTPYTCIRTTKLPKEVETNPLYYTDGIYAASALAGNAVTRSFFGGTLPLAGPSMYETLTPQWAGTLLGLLELMMIPIPIVFYRYGEKIRSKSKIIRQMREDQEKNERRAERTQRRKARRQGQEEEKEKGNDSSDNATLVREAGGEEKIASRDAEKSMGVDATPAKSKDETVA
ncbi:polyamine transporter 3 [Xylariaceae sp. FL0016]|nr:polyamine transporter 3 [Xylariaceae sp. FL0016]